MKSEYNHSFFCYFSCFTSFTSEPRKSSYSSFPLIMVAISLTTKFFNSTIINKVTRIKAKTFAFKCNKWSFIRRCLRATCIYNISKLNKTRLHLIHIVMHYIIYKFSYEHITVQAFMILIINELKGGINYR